MINAAMATSIGDVLANAPDAMMEKMAEGQGGLGNIARQLMAARESSPSLQPQQMQQPLTPQGGVASLGNRQDMADKLANMGQFDDDQIAHVAEGEVIVTSDIRPDADAITAILPQFTGQISQIPPAYSAIKIDGKRAYDLARQGADEVVLAARDIMIHRLALTAHTNEDACFVTSCGKGTYIRSLARDIATALGTVAHVSHLRRTAVGQFTQENAISLDSLQELGHSAAASPYVIPVVTALDDIPALPITTVEAQKLRFGQRLPPRPALSKTQLYKALCDGTLVALVEATEEGLKSVRVFNC